MHTDAPTAGDTDWGQIATLYSQLHDLVGSPIVALNRAIAVAELDGPAVALAEVDRLDLATYHLWHATRADLLRRLGRSAEARAGVRRRAGAHRQRGRAQLPHEAPRSAGRVTLSGGGAPQNLRPPVLAE